MVYSVFLLLPFPLLMSAYLFATNFPDIPFANPTCSNVWLFLVFLLFLFMLSCFMFLLFCFMLALFLVCFPFVFVCFLFCCQTMKETLFPYNSSVFELCWLIGSLFLCFMFLFLCLYYLVLFVCSLNNEVVLLYLFCFLFCYKTRWLSCLHLVVLFIFCCFVPTFSFFLFSFLSKKAKKPDTAKTQKTKMQENTPNFVQLAQLCSQIVFPIVWGGLKTAEKLKTL